jgi:hypothetical protein
LVGLYVRAGFVYRCGMAIRREQSISLSTLRGALLLLPR